MNSSRFIYHITDDTAWQKARPSGWYTPPGFAADGFIHCSDLRQVTPVADRLYTGQRGLALLQIVVSRLVSRVVYENLEGGLEPFPHIYGELNVDAVSRAIPFDPGPDGRFTLPVELVSECPG